MSYTKKITALNKGLAPIFPEQDRINFAPKLAGDIRVLLPTDDGSEKYLTLNHVYSEDDNSDSKVYIPALNGTVWTVSDIEGWWNLSDPEMPDIQRGFGDGSFDVTGRNQARTVNLTGSILITESSREEIAALNTAARTALINAFNLVKRGTWLIVDEDDYKRAAFVRLSGKPEITTTNSRGRIDFSIGLKAADPTKYEWYPVSDMGVVPEGFIGDGNAFRISKTTGGTSGYRTYDSSGTISGVRVITGKVQPGTLSATYATNTVTVSISGSTSIVADNDYIYVSGLTYTNATGSTTNPFIVSGTTTVGGGTIKYTAPTGTTAISGTPVLTVGYPPSATASYSTNTIILTLSSKSTSLVADGAYIYVTGLTYTGATGSTTGPFLVNGSTTVGGSTIKYTAPTGTTGVSGTPFATLQEQTSSYRTYPTLGNLGNPDSSINPAYDAGTVSATYATNVVTLTVSNGRSLVNDGDYVKVTGLTYTSATGSTTDPFLVSGGTTIGGTTINYAAPTGTTGISGTPVVTIAEETSYYRTYPNTMYANSSSGRLSVFNYGTTNIPCYIRFVGPLFGPAVIANSTTNQEINIIAPTTVGQQILYPSETISTVQFLGIDTKTHEVHIGDYYNGVTSTNARGLLSPLIDWIYLAPGLNDISYEDSGAKTSAGNIEIYWQSGWDG